MTDTRPIDPAYAQRAAARLRENVRRVIYLSGPMTGVRDKNFPAFTNVSAELRSMGHRVYSPHEFPKNWGPGHDVRKAFAAYCSFICLEAEDIVMLPGWQESQGCLIELGLALKCGLRTLMWLNNYEIEEFHPRHIRLG